MRALSRQMLTPWYPFKAAGVFAGVVAVAVMQVRAHHPFPRFGPANQVTMVRALLVSLIAVAMTEPRTPAIALAVVGASAVATLLDGVDGWLARRSGLASAFGARFDMEVDAALIQILAILAWQHEKAGAWILLSGLFRYLFVAAGWIWRWLRRPLFASTRRKAICVAQIAGLVIAMAPAVAPPTSNAVAAVSLLILAYSFFADTVWLWQRRSATAAA